jgi:prepilin peptidase CpaA
VALDISCVPFVVVAIAATIAGVVDVRSFRVPNALTVPLLLSGVLFHGVVNGLAGLQMVFFGLLFGFGVIFLLYLIGAIGAGDVKLMAAVGAWLGMPATLYVFVVAALATGLYSVAILLREGGLRRAFIVLQIAFLQLAAFGKHLGAEERVESVVKREDRRKHLVPFAGMVALGVIVVIVLSLLQFGE